MLATDSKLTLIYPKIGSIDLEELPLIHIKTVPNILSDIEPLYIKGKKIKKSWYISELDRKLNLPCFTKNYEYKLINNNLNIKTICKWYNIDEKVIYKVINNKTYSQVDTLHKLAEYREIKINRFKNKLQSLNNDDNIISDLFKHYNIFLFIISKYDNEEDKKRLLKVMDKEKDKKILQGLKLKFIVEFDKDNNFNIISIEDLIYKTSKMLNINILDSDNNIKNINVLKQDIKNKKIKDFKTRLTELNMIKFLNLNNNSIKKLTIKQLIKIII